MKLIGIGHKKQVGKNTVATILAELLKPATSLQFAFADELKREVSEATGISVTELKRQKDRFRPLLQWWGTEFRRQDNPDYWIDKLQEQINFYNVDYGIITDVRFWNEATFISTNGGYLINIERDLAPKDLHISDTDLDNYQGWHLDILNNGDLNQLRLACNDAIINIEQHFSKYET